MVTFFLSLHSLLSCYFDVVQVVEVSSMQAAIAYVNKNPKPLSLYIFSNNKKTQDTILCNTRYIIGSISFGGEKYLYL